MGAHHRIAVMATHKAQLVRGAIDVAALGATTPADGALCLFLGVVRNENDGRPVLHLEYEAYDEMALGMMEDIAAQAAARWPVTEVRVVHRLGRLEIGEASVAVAVASPHRGEAFAACRALIDRIKSRLPIWKREHGPEGPYWVGWEDARCDEHGHGHPK